MPQDFEPSTKAQSALAAAIVSAMMTCVVSGISTLRALGPGGDFLAQWLLSWLVSWLVAYPILFLLQPVVRRFVARFWA